jgi:D-arabinose 1-dehydrogenase-like Zn-dependent alcohol dehydrogenase
MKAAVIDGHGHIEVREIPIPEPREYEALCEILCCATCSGTDLHLINGNFIFPPKYPAVLGHESIGRVVKTGPKVRYLKPGDIVTKIGAPPALDGTLDSAWGGFSEFGIAKDHRAMKEDGLPEYQWYWQSNQLKVDASINPIDATMIITWRETLSFLKNMGVSAGSSVLIIGSGGNGLAFAANAANLSCSRIDIIGSLARRVKALECGATGYYVYTDVSLEMTIADSNNEGYDFIVDTLAKNGPLNRVLPCLKAGGAISVFGTDERDALSITPSRARGDFVYMNQGYTESDVHQEVMNLIHDGKLKAELWLDAPKTYTIDEINEAFQLVAERKAVKAVIKFKD